jgi:hypothetical protein
MGGVSEITKIYTEVEGLANTDLLVQLKINILLTALPYTDRGLEGV